LSAQEIDATLICCVQLVQHISYKQEIRHLQEKQEVSPKSSLRSLHPFLDQQGILRVGGRIQQSSLPYQMIHQMILPVNHHFTKLVVTAEHLKLHHAGPQLLVANLRQRFWISSYKDSTDVCHTSMFNVLQVEGTGFKAIKG
jgi:hypothetical protein